MLLMATRIVHLRQLSTATFPLILIRQCVGAIAGAAVKHAADGDSDSGLGAAGAAL